MPRPWRERLPSWLERVLAYALAISPPIALLLALTITMRSRRLVSQIWRDRWTVGVFVLLMVLGTASLALAPSPWQALQGPVGLALLFLFWVTGRVAIQDPIRFWVDLQRAIGIIAVLAIAAVFGGVTLRYSLGSVESVVVAPVDTGTVFGLGANGLGPLLVFGCILAIGRMFQFRSIWERLEALVIAMATLAAALALGVRSALWGAAVGTAVLLPIAGPVGLAVILSASLLVILVRPGILSSFAQLLDPSSNLPRWFAWQNAWAMVRDRPWLGVGPFHFMDLRERYLPAAAIGIDFGLLGAHNIYLRMASEWGVPAAVVLFTWLFSWPIRLWPYRAEIWRWSLVAGLVSFLAMGIFDDPLFTLHISGPVFLGLGLASATPSPPQFRQT